MPREFYASNSDESDNVSLPTIRRRPEPRPRRYSPSVKQTAGSECISCHRTFPTLHEVEEHSISTYEKQGSPVLHFFTEDHFDRGHIDFRKNSELPRDRRDSFRRGDFMPDETRAHGRKTRTALSSSNTSSSHEPNEGKEKEEEVVVRSAEELIPEICRIDGSYKPGTRTHTYDLYREMMGPTHQEKSDIPQMYSQWVLLLVREFDEDYNLQKTFIRINSPLIKETLANALRSGDAAFQTSKIRWPSDKLFRYRGKIRQAAQDMSELTVKHVAPLLQLIESEYSDRIEELNNMLPHALASYEILKDVFMPGDIAVSKKASITRAYRVINAFYQEGQAFQPPSFKVEVEYIDYDGENLGTVKDKLSIPKYEGVKHLHSLSVCPVNYLPDKATVMKELGAQGRNFLNLRGRHFKFYNGDASPLSDWKNLFKVRSRVMVDSLMLGEFKPSYRVEVTVPVEQHKESEVSEDDLIICTNQVPAFSFRDKTFFWADLNQLREISFNDQAFDHLILPVRQKELIRAFVNSYSNGDDFDDFIAGKGKGLCFLLHGSPGVGKTMTAEAISDLLQRPLYAVTSGELGTSPSEMEKKLQKALDRAAYFKSVLLLDEADVFLEQRNAQDLTRNALVSTFLRLLEYYQGVMFLTTNRLESFDTAVSSRIHMTLRIGELNMEAREAVWRSLGKLNDVKLDFATLAKVKLNGRQIKNAFRSGVILARDKQVGLSMEHIQIVLEATGLVGYVPQS